MTLFQSLALSELVFPRSTDQLGAWHQMTWKALSDSKPPFPGTGAILLSLHGKDTKGGTGSCFQVVEAAAEFTGSEVRPDSCRKTETQ